MAGTWLDFWNGKHAIYVNARHKALHDRFVARDIAALITRPDLTVLDYGCGEAGEAATLADQCGRLLLCDAAPAIRERAAARYGDIPNIAVLTPGDVVDLPEGSLDFVVVNSLLQYLPREEWRQLARLFRAKLRPNGLLVVGDVIPPDLSTVEDVAALLRFAFAGGFLFAALAGLVRTFFSDYRRLRTRLGFAAYAEADMIGLLEAAGFAAQRRYPNIGHHQGRMTFTARPM